jgi:DNA recombination protein RmuC
MDPAFAILAAALVAAAGLVAFAVLRRAPPRDTRLDGVITAQGQIAGQFRQSLEAQAQLQKAIGERIDALNARLGQSLSESAAKTAETLGGIQTRLSTIDEAQKNITALSGQVVSLQEILSDKQSRGAFGQERMEAIVADQLPPSHYDFQHTLSNGKRPDCIIRLPNVKGVIVVDSKFPLEAFESLRGLAGDEERKAAAARLKADVLKHVKDIAEKYLIPGEVQTPAIMFVPSESVYAELYTSFGDVVQQARRMQVVIVSPHVFMLAINTIQTLMRDARMREQAGLIQKEVGQLSKDVKLLADATDKLQRHLGQAEGDIKDILTRSGRIVSRADRIEKVELSAPEAGKALPEE